MSVKLKQQVKVPKSLGGMRLDQIAAELFPDFSRSRLQTWIKSAHLLVDDREIKAKTRLSGGELLSLDADVPSQEAWVEEDITLNVVYEDAHILVVNKPAGLVVHPGAGNWSGTLLNSLIYHFKELKSIPRAGIVHRLDKDTTGLMVVAKTISSQVSLVEQLQDRSVSRTYRAVVYGETPEKGTVSAPIGRHPTQRTKMSVLKSGGKEAVTHYRQIHHINGCSLVELKLETGRTHQIRVHMSHLGFPLLGDPVYGRNSVPDALSHIGYFDRQALHACALGLIHPSSAEPCRWEVPLPDDMCDLLTDLELEENNMS